jgi:hypothetical protein
VEPQAKKVSAETHFSCQSWVEIHALRSTRQNEVESAGETNDAVPTPELRWLGCFGSDQRKLLKEKILTPRIGLFPSLNGPF